MPRDAQIVIDRLTTLRDMLQLKAAKIRIANFGKDTPQTLELIDQWGKIKDRLQEIVNLNFGIDFNEKAIAEGDPNASHPKQLARIERDKTQLTAKLKTVKQLENKGNKLLSLPSESVRKPTSEEKPPVEKPKKTPASPGKVPQKDKPPAPPKAVGPMTFEEYQTGMAKLKAQGERAVVSQLPDLETQAYDLVVQWLVDLDTQNGRLVANEATRTALNNFTDLYLTTFTELSDYQGMVSKYLKNFKSMAQLQDEFQRARGFDPKKAQVGSAQEVVVAEIIDRYTENGLNQGFVQPLRELLFNNVAGGLNKKQALTQVQRFIANNQDSTGKLGLYLEQTAQQGVDSYEGVTNTRIMQAFKINTLLMSGSLIETSSPQCRYCINKLGGLIDRSDWPDVQDIAKNNGLIEGTTFDNVTFNRLHWGCRHSFTPVALSEDERSQLLQNPTNQ